MPRRIVLHTVVACAALAAACARAPDDELCPPVGAGDLVITELRGPQAPDSWGQWIELHNATGGELDLEGTQVILRSVDGRVHNRILVRRSVPVEPGGYVVLGAYPDATRPAHVDYGFGGVTTDFTRFPGSGGVTANACGLEIDALAFLTPLPTAGTRSLGGPPSATANDDESAWCDDTSASTDTTKVGLPGTPGAANNPCN